MPQDDSVVDESSSLITHHSSFIIFCADGRVWLRQNDKSDMVQTLDDLLYSLGVQRILDWTNLGDWSNLRHIILRRLHN